MAEWLVWRNEIAAEEVEHLRKLARTMEATRNQAIQQIAQARTGAEAPEADLGRELGEAALVAAIKKVEAILENLDGQLSPKNATLMGEFRKGAKGAPSVAKRARAMP